MKKTLSLFIAVVVALNIFAFASPIKSQAENTTYENAVLIEEGSSYDFPISVKESGKYALKIKYKIQTLHGTSVDCNIKINNGDLDGLFGYKLNVSYSLGEVTKDRDGNELTPAWSMIDKWYDDYVYLETAFNREIHTLQIEKGEYSINILPTNASLYVESIAAVYLPETKTQSEYLAQYGTDLKNSVDIEPTTIQAENLNYALSKVILPSCDSSVSVTPIANRLQVMNYVGGATWNLTGQEANWEIVAPADGWYSISLRYLQDYTDGRDVIRELKIDGSLPFKDCSYISFPYESKWTDITLGNANGVFKFYLTKGKHILSLAPSLGETGNVLSNIQEVLSSLNKIYRKIIMITSSTPDTYRDYRLDEKIPDTIKLLGEEKELLEKYVKQLPDGTNCSLLLRLIEQMDKMHKAPNTIAAQLGRFQSNLSSLGTWINDQKTQPLALDEITLFDANSTYKKESVGFFKSLFHGIKRFFNSFISDYLISEDTNSEKIEAWITTGRDQMQIIRRLTAESFTVNEDIYVDLRLIAGSALLPAVVAGIGPDISLHEDSGTPVNFASRGQIFDLNTFPDAKEVCSRFSPQALVPYQYEGGLYALPETMNFKMLFYRKDIFEEYGWSVPQTWQDVTNLIFDLSKNNMEFGLDTGFPTYCMLLAQNGGNVYNEKGTAAVFDDANGVEAFRQYTQLYSEYKIPVSYNFANRFRSGQMPIAINEYTLYNTLEVFAPEIKGLWDIAMVPGIMQEDGTINRTSVASGGCCLMLKDTDNPEAAWKFMKWWTSADIQAKYGNQIEDRLGASARYATANLEALSQLPWSTAFYNELTSQIENVVGVPQVPGGYFTARHFTNAFRSVVYSSTDCRETLQQYVKVINDEITKKRKEFGLSVDE